MKNVVSPLKRPEKVDSPSKVTPITHATKIRSKVNIIPVFPATPSPPSWLQSLFNIQSFSTIFTLTLLAISLGVYSQTIYIQKRWSDQYQSLEKLRRLEQQLNATNEVLKHEIAGTGVHPSSGLMPQNPHDMIFLESTPNSTEKILKIPPKNPEKSVPILSPKSTPLGY